MSDFALVSIGGSPELQRRQANVNLTLLRAATGYGADLPDAATCLDGALFTKSGTDAGLYQLQSGAWVAV